MKHLNTQPYPYLFRLGRRWQGAFLAFLMSLPIGGIAIASDRQLRFPEGHYLFGEAAEPEQVGSIYIVFAAREGQVTGAFYMPYSSFDCFQGQVEGDRLAVTIRNSYEQTTVSYEIALVERQSVFASEAAAPLDLGLEGLNAMEGLSANDERMLEICQSEPW